MPAQPTPPSNNDSASRPAPPRLRVVAVASGLLNEGQIAAAEATVRAHNRVVESIDPRGWDKEVAVECVRQKLLTKFQARELLAGRRRFTLGQYRMLEEIGRGGMGQVFKAEHVMMKRIVAVKVLPLSKANPNTEAAFQREIEMLGKLHHENIVGAHDSGYDGNVYYLVTEYVPGVDLRRQVSRHGPLDQQQAVAVGLQVARGLAYAHRRGLIHRDVKPGNILVCRDGRARVLDLGLAGSVFDPESMLPGRRVGTPGYMPPEQIEASQAVGPAADVFGLGCTLYFALTGKAPFPGDTREEKEYRTTNVRPPAIRKLVPSVDKALVRVIEAMMRLSLVDRIKSADEVIQQLQPWASDGLVAIPQGGIEEEVDEENGQSALPSGSALRSGLSSESASRSDRQTPADTYRGEDGQDTPSGLGPENERDPTATAAEEPAEAWTGQIVRACLLAAPISVAAAAAAAVSKSVLTTWGPSPLFGGVVVFLVVAGGMLAMTRPPRRGPQP